MTRKRSATRDDKHAAREVDSDCRVSCALERAILTIGRDCVLRRQYLRKRWQGYHSIEEQPRSESPLPMRRAVTETA